MNEIRLRFEDFETIEARNRNVIESKLANHITIFTQLFDVQQTLFHNHIAGIKDPYYDFSEYRIVLMQACRKNSFLLYNSHALIVRGQYGAANILLRQIFEFLIIGKHCSTQEDDIAASKWLDNRQYNVYKSVISKLAMPINKNINEFWKILCNYSHATTSSNQVFLSAEIVHQEIYTAYTFLLLLLRCNYHLLNTHFIDRGLIYRCNKWYPEVKDENSLKRREAKNLKKLIATRP